SICVHCGLGCNIIPGERYGSLRRVRNRYNQHINGYFLCDRGRYGYEFVNSPSRIRNPLIRARSQPDATATDQQGALQRLSEILEKDAVLIGIGSPRATLEGNYALRKLVGKERFFAGVSARDAQLTGTILHILQDGSVPAASQQEAAMSDAVLVLGEDLNNTAPRLALALRQSIRNQPLENAQRLKIDPFIDSAIRQVTLGQKGPLFLATTFATRLEDAATGVIHLAPDDIARLGYQIAHLLDLASPAVAGLSAESETLAAEIAEQLKNAKRPLIISGASLGNSAIVEAAANVARALQMAGQDARLTYTFPEANSLGLAMLGQGDLEQALNLVKQTPDAVLIILENDLFRRADEQLIRQLLDSASSVIVLDTLETPTAAAADLVLPAATFAEGDGTLVNNEGRAQRFFQVMNPQPDVQES
ncbi:MAG: molybdopterin-dependent oxidoreductase, partial [Anaerolineaceae bacterium]